MTTYTLPMNSKAMSALVRVALFALLCLMLTLPAKAALPGLSDVLAARRLLTEGSWSKILRIETREPGRARSSYSFGLVFELASALWLYQPEKGTQSLSTRLANTEKDKEELGLLLSEAVPNYQNWKEEKSEVKVPARYVPLNACFIESVALLRSQRRKGVVMAETRLFSLYYTRQGRQFGHTVLYFESAGEAYLLDPAHPETPRRLNREQTQDKRLAAQVIAGKLPVTNVRELPI